jgi:hypothetical protein
MLLTDCARFLGDDPDELIEASFACVYCLGEPSSVVVNLEEPGGSAALCRCDDCDADWMVALNLDQAMRLALAPPRHINLTPA